MNTTISIDKKIRDKVAKKAQNDCMTVSAVIRILLNDYADGKIQIGARVVSEPKFEIVEVDDETQDLMDDVVNIWHKK